jgi:uncharacterized protein
VPLTLRSVLALAGCAIGGAVSAAMSVPLPWMLGPLVTMAAMRMAGWPVGALPGSRQLGQALVGAALGLYFTATVVAQVVEQWLFLTVATGFCVVIALAGALVVARVGRVDGATAFFASVPGGALEMFNLAERHGARSDLVAAAQSLRILLVVATVPPAFALLGLHGTELVGAVGHPVRPAVLAGLLAACAIAAWLMDRWQAPNAWLLGPLLVSTLATVAGASTTTIPALMVNGAQVLIGTALGARFDRAALLSAGRFTAAVCIGGFMAIGLTIMFSTTWAVVTGLPIPAVVLATAPGGLAEMCLTAKALHYAVPLVTAAHVTRIVVLVLGTGLVFKWSRHWLAEGGERAL